MKRRFSFGVVFVIWLMVVLIVCDGWVRAGGPVLAGKTAGGFACARQTVPLAEHAASPLRWEEAPGAANPDDPFVRAKLAEIGMGIDKAFAYVRDRIAYESYAGSLRGARGTLWSQAGNSLDQASLLLALLGAQNIKAKYARGTLAAADARALLRSMFDPVVAANAVGYIPERFPRYDPAADPGLLSAAADHWWVELEDGTALDASFRDLAVGQARGAKTGTFNAIPDGLRHTVVVRLKAEWHNPLSQYTTQTPLEVELNTADVYGRALTLGHFLNVYQAPALVAGWKTFTYSPYLMVDDNDADWTNNHLIRGTDYQEFSTGLFPLANSVLTRLTLEFEVRDPGRIPDLRTRDLLDRVGYAARKGLAQPGPVDPTRPAVTELDVATFFFTPGFVVSDLVSPHQAILAALDPELAGLVPTVSSLASKPATSLTASDQALVNRYAMLNRAAIVSGGSVVAGAFLLDSDYHLRQMRDAHQVRAYYNTPRITVFETRACLNHASSTLRMGLDLRRNQVLAVPYPGQSTFDFFAFNLAKGRVDSILEHLKVEQLLAEDFPEVRRAASPVQALQQAKSDGVRIQVLRGEQDLPTRLEPLPLSAEAKARIADALRSGQVVNVPGQMIQVNGRPGIGWWQIDMRTGEAVAVGEDGGHQALIEFGVLSTLVAVAGVFALSVLGGSIRAMFTAANAKPRGPEVTASTTPRDKLTSTSSGLDATRIEAYAGYHDIQTHGDGSLTIRIDGQEITLPQSAIEKVHQVTEAVGSSGSVVDWAGTDVEVIFHYAPGPLAEASQASMTGPDFAMTTLPERTFVVKHRENPVPSAYRLALENTGLPDPGALSAYLARTNAPLFFRVTGTNRGTLWGTDRYTDASPLATAAVHAGVLTNGQTGTVKVRMLPPGDVHPGSTRNGVTSRSYVGVPAGDYRVESVDPSVDLALFQLSGTAPEGWNLLFARTQVGVPPGVVGQFSVFLQPDDAAPLPPPGTTVPFAIDVAPVAAEVSPHLLASHQTAPASAGERRRLDGRSATQAMTFVMPEVYGLRMEADPGRLQTSPDGKAAFQVLFENTGNLPLQADLSSALPPALSLDGLVRSVSLAPNEQMTLALTLNVQGAPVNTDHVIGLTASFGPDRAQKRQVAVRVTVAVPGALQALQAASDAQAIGRDSLAATLESLGKGLSQLYGVPSDPVRRSCVLASLDTLGRQLDDPLLSRFRPGLASERDALAKAAPDQVVAALEALGVEVRALAQFMATLARHDFEVALRPNTADALPDTATRFGLYLRNRGRVATTYDLSLEGVPAGMTGGLTRSSITLQPGEATSPTLSGVEPVFVVLTQPTGRLQAFPFTVTAQARPAPALTRAATGAFTVRDELVAVLDVQATPPFIEPRWETTTVGGFTGGDVGEGLDLDGEFLYAVNVGGNAVGRIREADFTGPNVPGVTLTAVWGGGHAREFGSTDNDNRLESVMLSDRYGNPDHPVTIQLGRLTQGQPYKLQLLFAEDWTSQRGFDVLMDGEVLADDLNLAGAQGGVATRDRAVVLTHEFLAAADTVTIRLDGSRVTGFSNRDPLLCGFTLEAVRPEPVRVSARILNAVNVDRAAWARLIVKAPDGTPVREAIPQAAALTTEASLAMLEAGTFDATGLAPGVYRLAVSLTEADGQPIAGAQAEGSILVGTPVQASLTAHPPQLPPGTGEVEVTLSVTHRGEPGTNGLSLVGLKDTPGTAQFLALARGLAYVGGSESAEIVDVSNAWNPRRIGALATNEAATALAGDHLLVRQGFGVDVYALDQPARPGRVGGCSAGFTGATFPVHFFTHGDFALSQTLIFGYGTVAIHFVRGDLAAYDLRDPATPVPLGLLFNTPHASFPEYVGGDYFIGQPAAKDGVIFLPSTTGKDSASSGQGRLTLVNARTAGSLVVAGDLAVPDTRVLTAVAIAGDRALVLGNTLGFGLRDNVPTLLGDVTVTLVDVSDPLQPALLGPTRTLGGIDPAARWKAQVYAGPGQRFFLTDITAEGRPQLWLLDASDPSALGVSVWDVTDPVECAEFRDGLLYTVSRSGLAIYDAGGLAGLPIVAEVTLPKAGVSLVPGSFNLPPDEVLTGVEYDTARWWFDLGIGPRSRTITWRARVTDLSPGTSREIAHGGSVACSAWGIPSNVKLPTLSVACPHWLGLTPATQQVHPGAEAAYMLSLTNPTEAVLNFTLSIPGLPPSWLTMPTSVSVPAQRRTDVPLAIRPESVAALGEHAFRVEAEGGVLLRDSVQGALQLTGPPVRNDDTHGVVLTLLPADVVAGRGALAFVNVRLTNTGNVTETFEVLPQLPQGVTGSGGPWVVEVPPGVENYREVRVGLTPELGTAPGAMAFRIVAQPMTPASPQATASGTLTVLSSGVVLTLAPERALLGTPLTLRVSNPGPTAQTFDLLLGGPLAGAARLGQGSVVVGPGVAADLPVTFAMADFAYPGEWPLLATATSRADPRVQAVAAALLEVLERHGLAARFDPELIGLIGPGDAVASLALRNIGNVEEECRLEIIGLDGPISASLQGPDGRAMSLISRVRLPGLAGGGVLLRARLSAHQPARVSVRLSSTGRPGLAAEATAHFLPGVWLSLERLEKLGQEQTRLWFTPLPGYRHVVESCDALEGGAVWSELPAAPHNQGEAWDGKIRDERFYRVRLELP